MVRFTEENEFAHDQLMASVSKTLDASHEDLNKVESELSEIGNRCTEMMQTYSDYDDLVENVASAITAKSEARHKVRLAKKFVGNPMPTAQKKFNTLMKSAKSFLKVSEHHLRNAEGLIPDSSLSM